MYINSTFSEILSEIQELAENLEFMFEKKQISTYYDDKFNAEWCSLLTDWKRVIDEVMCQMTAKAILHFAWAERSKETTSEVAMKGNWVGERQHNNSVMLGLVKWPQIMHLRAYVAFTNKLQAFSYP